MVDRHSQLLLANDTVRELRVQVADLERQLAEVTRERDRQTKYRETVQWCPDHHARREVCGCTEVDYLAIQNRWREIRDDDPA